MPRFSFFYFTFLTRLIFCCLPFETYYTCQVHIIVPVFPNFSFKIYIQLSTFSTSFSFKVHIQLSPFSDLLFFQVPPFPNFLFFLRYTFNSLPCSNLLFLQDIYSFASVFKLSHFSFKIYSLLPSFSSFLTFLARCIYPIVSLYKLSHCFARHTFFSLPFQTKSLFFKECVLVHSISNFFTFLSRHTSFCLPF